ncbi:hypothetical protein CKM354_000350100 [Cercospora kikuchii]|uniref:Uncharacterized protein n=1 Tax=Cercospora kikuchii TaxID=84275 RepID=A0A9P3C9M7_9PEZI|nr:uncharacterized protein CKM354_000350100 [Cercospora kikuchii]GIZ40149.1 hypothetical protein CKM354_000350100 [Cercospora kikuchii]
MAEIATEITADGIIDAVRRYLARQQIAGDKEQITAAIKQPEWVLHIQDRMPAFRPEEYTKRNGATRSDRCKKLIRLMENITGGAELLLPWKIPGFYAIIAYN